MLVWKGSGLLVLVTLVVGVALGDAAGGSAGTRSLAGYWTAALLTFVLGIVLEGDRSPPPGQTERPPARHHFLFIPVEAWPWLFAAIGVVKWAVAD
ncbi:hypothetical protein J0H58_11355 [bacterium]|nr:hypothetical protein [bacterium]